MASCELSMPPMPLMETSCGSPRAELAHHAQRDRTHCLRRITAGNRVAFNGRHRPQRVEIDANHGEESC